MHEKRGNFLHFPIENRRKRGKNRPRPHASVILGSCVVNDDSASKDLAAFPPSAVLFSHQNSADLNMVSLGFVIDQTGTRVMGALYGAGATKGLDNNRKLTSNQPLCTT